MEKRRKRTLVVIIGILVIILVIACIVRFGTRKQQAIQGNEGVVVENKIFEPYVVDNIKVPNIQTAVGERKEKKGLGNSYSYNVENSVRDIYDYFLYLNDREYTQTKLYNTELTEGNTQMGKELSDGRVVFIDMEWKKEKYTITISVKNEKLVPYNFDV